MDKLRLFGKDIAAVTATVMFMAMVIALFGGRAVPWFTPAEAAALKQEQQATDAKITDALKKTTETLEKTVTKLDTLGRIVGRYSCKDANESLRLANEGLNHRPNDQVAAKLRETSLDSIRTIDGGVPETR